MTVKELINELLKMPQDMVVVVNAEKNESANGQPVTAVSEIDVYIGGNGRYHVLYYEDEDETEFVAINITA